MGRRRDLNSIPYQVAPKQYATIKAQIFKRHKERLAVLMESVDQHPLEEIDKAELKLELAIAAAAYVPEDDSQGDLSGCCNAATEVIGSEGGTSYYLCTYCNQPCDIAN